MAATRLIALHINKGKTVAQCLADRTDYSQNAAKTEDGKYISSYECDPKTADEEFLLTKRQYQHITGRQQKNDIIAYQIRQSFKPGEITPEEANQVGYETAMRWTKGKHAFIVATHIDRSHIHNHIIYNSTSLDCTRKFKNFFLSGLAVQRLSDMLAIPEMGVLNIMGLASPTSAILFALIFNAIIIPCLIPLAMKGVKYRPMSSSKMLVRNLMIYGVGGIITPFVGIKIIDLIISPLLEMIGFIGF